MLLEDATETFDPILDPLLGKQIEKKGSDTLIKFGESPVQYNMDFQLFITTKISAPHYSPEICVKLTMLNFMVTFDGLKDQMLSIVVRIEDESKYNKRVACIIQ